MINTVILGSGQAGSGIAKLINPAGVRLRAFGDNDPSRWGENYGVPVVSVADALGLKPELVILGVIDREREGELEKQLEELGYKGEILSAAKFSQLLDIRSAALINIAERIRKQRIPGACGELGVYKGDFAQEINKHFPDRTLYLFDTFEGFSPIDIKEEAMLGTGRAEPGDFSDTSISQVLSKLEHRERAVIRPGHFPETVKGLEEQFCFVSLDADLYAPTLAGLKYFYPRLSSGGVMIIHDYGSRRFDGVRRAVEEYEKAEPLLLLQLGDLHGTGVVMKS